MGLYLMRALKYFLRLAIIIAVVLAVLAASGMLATRGAEVLTALFVSWRGAVLLGVIVLLAVLYPSISFTTVRVRGSLETNRDDVINSFATYGYSLAREDEHGMTFRANSFVRRLAWQFDDAVTVSSTDSGKYLKISGTKKIVPRVEVRLNAFWGR